MVVNLLNSSWNYVGNGVTTSFAWDNLVIKAADLDVYLDGVLQTITVDYTVAGAGTDAGTVDFVVAPANAVAVAIIRKTERDQQTAYPNNGPFPSSSHEAALDKLTIINQEDDRDFRKALRFNEFSLSEDIFVDEPVAGKLLSWAADALSVVSTTAASLGAVIISDIVALVDGVASAGVSDEVSRVDHVHPLASAVAETLTNKIINDITNFVHSDGVHIHCRNVSGSALVTGMPVYISGWNAGQGAIEIELADANVIAAMPALGIIHEDIANNANGMVITTGVITGDATYNLDTSSFSVGDDLFISTTAGELTNISPTGSSDLVQPIAKVMRSHASLGVIQVDGPGHQALLPNDAGGTLGTVDVLTSSSSHTFPDIPAGTNEIIVTWYDCTPSGTSTNFSITIGDSGGLETSGYNNMAKRLSGTTIATSAARTDRFDVHGPNFANSSYFVSGTAILTRHDGNKWTCVVKSNDGVADLVVAHGRKDLSGELTQLSFFITDSQTFTAGQVNIEHRK